ncbi:MAG: PAS domain S-box protein [Bacteroidia bacterium]|nr:PAS domain S-box protein [Bacteroidia bacterium]
MLENAEHFPIASIQQAEGRFALTFIPEKSFLACLAPTHRDQFAGTLHKNAATGISSFQLNPLPLAGDHIWVSMQMVALRDESGRITRYQAYLLDVTAQVLASKDDFGNDPYKELFEKSADALLIIKREKFIDCNEATIKMLGYATKDEFLNTHPSELSPEYQPDGMTSREKVDIMNGLAYQNGSHRFEWDHVRSNGEVFPVEVLLTSIPSDNPADKTLHVVWRDITERKKAEREIASQNLILKNINQELEQFSYIASHDLQEPLRTMICFVDLIEEEFAPSLPPKAGQYLKFITDSSKRMRELVRGLMEYSRLGKERELTRVEMNKIAGQVLVDLGAVIEEKSARIRVNDLPEIRGYEVELRLLLQNLVSNALKFVPANTIPKIEVGCEEVEEGYKFFVKDNGIGIKKGDEDKIFIIFKRLHRREAFDGSGIGLSHCKKIVDIHGGRIWVESTPGAGSTFYFTIPKIA